MSTPRTEAALLTVAQRTANYLPEAVYANFARGLERELTNMTNAANSWRVDSDQLQRMVTTINTAMPYFKSAMGAECDHAELALGQLIVERDTLRAAAKQALGATLPRTFLRTALDSLYDDEPEKEAE